MEHILVSDCPHKDTLHQQFSCAMQGHANKVRTPNCEDNIVLDIDMMHASGHLAGWMAMHAYHVLGWVCIGMSVCLCVCLSISLSYYTLGIQM